MSTPIYTLCIKSISTQGPEHCVACRNLTLYSNNSSGARVRTCLGSCPVGTYLVSDRSECVPCHEHCSREVGCVGPLPYLDLQDGCLDCTLVQLDRNGSQVITTCTGRS